MTLLDALKLLLSEYELEHRHFLKYEGVRNYVTTYLCYFLEELLKRSPNLKWFDLRDKIRERLSPDYESLDCLEWKTTNRVQRRIEFLNSWIEELEDVVRRK